MGKTAQNMQWMLKECWITSPSHLYSLGTEAD